MIGERLRTMVDLHQIHVNGRRQFLSGCNSDQRPRVGREGPVILHLGYHFELIAGNPRQIDFRVYVTDGVPSEIEIFGRLRKADHRADQARAVRFRWPQEI